MHKLARLDWFSRKPVLCLHRSQQVPKSCLCNPKGHKHTTRVLILTFRCNLVIWAVIYFFKFATNHSFSFSLICRFLSSFVKDGFTFIVLFCMYSTSTPPSSHSTKTCTLDGLETHFTWCLLMVACLSVFPSWRPGCLSGMSPVFTSKTAVMNSSVTSTLRSVEAVGENGWVDFT